jgi:hypothetical protein
MAYPDAYIYEFSAEGAECVNYFETEHYQITHDFLVNPKRIFDVLLEPAPDPRDRKRRKPPFDP